jgi:hypothetical protein
MRTAFPLARRPVALLAFALLAGVVGGADPFSLPPEPFTLKETPGVDNLKSGCILCHSTEYVSTQPRLTRAQWAATVEKMRAKYGAPVATNQVSEIVEYLTKNYGRETPAKK